MPATPESLELFVSSCQGLKDEKSDSQTFLKRFFHAFGYADAIAAGAVMEKRIKKGSQKGEDGLCGFGVGAGKSAEGVDCTELKCEHSI